MANILDRYGIKEVADVTFYDIETMAPVLYLDTLKVSTIEQTAENTSARGGKGNPELIMWDYGKEITVTLEDALFSAKSLAIMYGLDTGNPSDFNASPKPLLRTVKKAAVGGSTGAYTFKVNGIDYTATEVKFFDENNKDVTSTVEDASAGEFVYATGTIVIAGTELVISANKFPGTYYVTGDTYARNEATGKDEFFQFIIPKAKMQSEVTLTLEAEGDPSTFSMNLKVLRPENGEMMKLVKYDFTEEAKKKFSVTCTSLSGQASGTATGDLEFTPVLEKEQTATAECQPSTYTASISENTLTVNIPEGATEKDNAMVTIKVDGSIAGSFPIAVSGAAG